MFGRSVCLFLVVLQSCVHHPLHVLSKTTDRPAAACAVLMSSRLQDRDDCGFLSAFGKLASVPGLVADVKKPLFDIAT